MGRLKYKKGNRNLILLVRKPNLKLEPALRFRILRARISV